MCYFQLHCIDSNYNNYKTRSTSSLSGVLVHHSVPELSRLFTKNISQYKNVKKGLQRSWQTSGCLCPHGMGDGTVLPVSGNLCMNKRSRFSKLHKPDLTLPTAAFPSNFYCLHNSDENSAGDAESLHASKMSTATRLSGNNMISTLDMVTSNTCTCSFLRQWVSITAISLTSNEYLEEQFRLNWGRTASFELWHFHFLCKHT